MGRVEQLGAWHAEVAGHQAERARWRAQRGLPPEQPTSRAEQRRAERAHARAERAGGHPDRTVPHERSGRDRGRGGLAGLLGGPPAPGSALARAWRACQPALARLHHHQQQQHDRADPHATRQPRTGRVARDHDRARERG
jgi:hypothetical protein